MIYIEDSLKKFEQLPLEIVLTIDNDKIAKKLDELGIKYKINLYPLLIFITTGDLPNNNIGAYLQREFNISELTTKKAVAEFEELILSPLLRRLNFLSGILSLDEKKEVVLNIFSNNLIEEFYNDSQIIEAINKQIFSILSIDLNFKKEMEKALYKNLEKLTHKKFILDSKTHTPSIRNWLTYFFKLKGTGIFDNVVATDFITKSENAKRLSEQEKKDLYRLLYTYRSIKFFPNSMPSDDGVNWEIIPLEKKEAKSLAKEREYSQKTGRAALLEQLEGNIDDYPENSLEREILEEESEKDREYHKLLLLAKKYPEGSLERRAVEDELAKMEKQL